MASPACMCLSRCRIQGQERGPQHSVPSTTRGLLQVHRLTVLIKVDFGRRTSVSHLWRRCLSRAVAPTVQDGSARDSHPGTPIESPLKPLHGLQPVQQPEPDWVCVPLPQPVLRRKRRSQLSQNRSPVRPHMLHPLPCRYGEGARTPLPTEQTRRRGIRRYRSSLGSSTTCLPEETLPSRDTRTPLKSRAGIWKRERYPLLQGKG